MRYSISGTIAQHVRLEFERGETAWAGKGSLMALGPGVGWRLRIPGGAGGAVRRSLSGEGLALTWLDASREGGYALLAANAPGQILPWDLSDGPVIATRGSFLAAWGESVDISVTIARRAGAAFFGGAGLFLQRISGRGTALIHASGNVEEMRLDRGEPILVSTGNLAAFGDSIDYDVQGVGGCSKILFSGEGFFMTRLTGPGRVILQSLKRQSARRQAPPHGGA